MGLLNDAEYNITNSFRATAFSTILHKNFFSFVLKDGRKMIGSRLYDFLEQFGPENLIHPDCPAENDTTPPDFTLADEKNCSSGRNPWTFSGGTCGRRS